MIKLGSQPAALLTPRHAHPENIAVSPAAGLVSVSCAESKADDGAAAHLSHQREVRILIKIMGHLIGIPRAVERRSILEQAAPQAVNGRNVVNAHFSDVNRPNAMLGWIFHFYVLCTRFSFRSFILQKKNHAFIAELLQQLAVDFQL